MASWWNVGKDFFCLFVLFFFRERQRSGLIFPRVRGRCVFPLAVRHWLGRGLRKIGHAEAHG